MSSDSTSRNLDGIWIIDAQGKTAYANDRMAQILHTTTANMIGRDSFAHVFDEDVPEAQRLFATKEAGSSAPFRFKLRCADASPIWVDVQGTPLTNAAGAFIGIVGTFTVSTKQG